MSDKYYITSDEIILTNPFSTKDIKISHKNKNFSVSFGKVKFEETPEFSTIKVGDWEIEENDNNQLIFKRNNNVLFMVDS